VASSDLAKDFKTPFCKLWQDKVTKNGILNIKVPKNFYNKFSKNILSEANAITEAVSSEV